MSFVTLALLAAMPHAAMNTDVSPERFANLATGVNLSHWWSQTLVGNYGEEHLETHTTEADFDIIAEAGLSHVRLPVEPMALWDESDPGAIPAHRLARFERDVDRIVARGLAVIVDAHPGDEFKRKLADDPEHVRAFARWWTTVAGTLADRDIEKVFFEPLNEPVIETAVWLPIQAELIDAIRTVAPNHTLIVGAGRWTGIDEFADFEPYEDRNLIYNFHCYDPFWFTHQGASWAGELPQSMREVPYPSSPEKVAERLELTSNPQSKQVLVDYGQQVWNKDRMRERLQIAADWAAEHGVYITCNEFGTYIAFSRPQERLAWIQDTREVLEELNIGWTMWDYQGGFALVDFEPTKRVSPEMKAALGLSE